MNRRASYQKLKSVLTNRRDGLRRVLYHGLKELRAGSGIDIGDAVDNAVDDEFNLVSSQLAQSESRELAQVEEALGRMRDGTYGVCESCNEGIPLARLQALPYARLCVQCQRTAEKGAGNSGSRIDWSQLRDEPMDDPFNRMFERVADSP
ncbi:MAG: TraR/DksA family transcriptional regulator [Pirellulaceae bacterium]